MTSYEDIEKIAIEGGLVSIKGYREFCKNTKIL